MKFCRSLKSAKVSFSSRTLTFQVRKHVQELLEVPPLKWPTSKLVYLPAKKENSSRLKKKAATEKDFAMQWSTKKQATKFDVVVAGKTCGETFGLVRFAGAVHVRANFCPHTGV